MPRHIAIIILALLLLMLALIGWSFFIPGSMEGTAQPHPDVPAMLQSKALAAETPIVIVLGSVFGVLSLAVMGLVGWAGLLKQGKETPLARWMLIAFGGYILVFMALFLTYSGYVNDPYSSSIFGGFPVPTAWMMYGAWFFPLVFIGLYSFLFKKWVVNEADMAQFEALLQQRRADNEG